MFTIACSSLENIEFPQKTGDVGYDLVASSEPKIVGSQIDDSEYYESIDYLEYEVDLKIQPPEGWHSYVFPRSSISNKWLQFCNSVGVIDNGYRGNIKIRFRYVAQPCDFEHLKYIKGEFYHENLVFKVNPDKIYKKGDRIGQLVFSRSLIPSLEIGVVSETERAESGFGSTNSNNQ